MLARVVAVPAAWLGGHAEEARNDLARIIAEHRELIRSSYRDWVDSHPELRQLVVGSVNPAALELAPSALVLGRAAVGDFQPFSAVIEALAQACAERGVGPHAACEWASAFRRPLLPKLVEAHASDPARLGRVLQLANDLGDAAARVAANAYRVHEHSRSWPGAQASLQPGTANGQRLEGTRQRTMELEAANLRMQEANRQKSEFLAGMSHELRTPLNSIIGFAELLHDEHVGTLSQGQKEFLAEILAGGRHLLRLINEVLDLAKVEAGKMDFRPEPVSLTRLVASVVQGQQAAARDKLMTVDVSVDVGLDDIVIDPGRFKQVLYNYLSNALKFTADGGRVSVRLMPAGDAAFCLEVEDTGVGIPDGDVQHLFTAFSQLESGAGKRHAGTGLGLALTKRLAEAQGGSVGLRRCADGSTFFAVLPRRPVRPSQAPG